MLIYFKEENEHIMRGMSLFIVTDSAQKAYTVKLIDFVSFDPIPEEKRKERDQGLIKGMLSLMRILDSILDECK